MDRRKFIGISGLSLIGSNGLFSSVSGFYTVCSIDNFNDFIALTGLKKGTLNPDNLLRKQLIDMGKPWFRSGYQEVEPGSIWKAGNGRLFMPLQLTTSDHHMIDRVMLVFNKNEDNQYFYAGSLSGFHLEAIERNKDVLNELGDKENIRNCILPYDGKGVPADGGWSYNTQKGSFELSVKIADGRTSVSSALRIDDKIIWQNSYLSNHGLFQNAQVLI